MCFSFLFWLRVLDKAEYSAFQSTLNFLYRIISYNIHVKTELWPILSQILLPWQPASLLLKFDWHHLIACPGEPPVRCKRLGDIFYTRRVKGDFVLNFVAMATGLVVVEFVWHHSVAHPRIPLTRCKWHRDIFYTCGVIVRFLSNFVAMETRVGHCKIWLTSFDSLTPKTPC